MIHYWLMPVSIKCLKAKVGVFKISKEKKQKKKGLLPPSMFTPTQTSVYCSGGNDSHDNLNLNYTLCTVVGTIWCDKHAGTVAAARLRTNLTGKKFKFKTCVSNSSTCRWQFYFSGICLSLSCAINSVCISLFPLSVNERYTCLWKCTPCNFLSFPDLCTLTVFTHNLNM